jgi:nucleoside-diphosphate-sugar epimerase
MQTILGASGPVGRELAKALTPYTKAIRLASRHPEKVNPSDELFATDLTISHELFKAVQGSEVVYITIGFPYDYTTWKEFWPPFMQNTINACKKHNAKLVFFDNVYMYDPDHIHHMTEETPVMPSSKKGQVRAEIANTLWDHIESGELKALIARSADFLGIKNSIPYEIVYKRFRKGKKAQWMLDDNKIHNFTYVKDAAKATALLGNSEKAYNHIWHLPTSKEKLTGKDWIELFAKEMNVKPKYSVIPQWMFNVAGIFNKTMRELGEMTYQFDRDYFFDSSRFEGQFNMQPTSAVEAVREIIRELKE